MCGDGLTVLVACLDLNSLQKLLHPVASGISFFTLSSGV